MDHEVLRGAVISSISQTIRAISVRVATKALRRTIKIGGIVKRRLEKRIPADQRGNILVQPGRWNDDVRLYLQPGYGDKAIKTAVGVTRGFYQHLYEKLEPYLPAPSVHVKLNDVPVTKHDRVASLLRWLVKGGTDEDIADRLQRSRSTANSIKWSTLQAYCENFYHAYVKLTLVPLKDILGSNRHRRYKHFGNVVGAFDGSHIPACFRKDEFGRFLNRKGFTSLNVMAVSNLNFTFAHLVSGNEGCACDSPIAEADTKPFLRQKTPRGYFYLADAIFRNSGMVLVPYRGVRLHILPHSHLPLFVFITLSWRGVDTIFRNGPSTRISDHRTTRNCTTSDTRACVTSLSVSSGAGRKSSLSSQAVWKWIPETMATLTTTAELFIAVL